MCIKQGRHIVQCQGGAAHIVIRRPASLVAWYVERVGESHLLLASEVNPKTWRVVDPLELGTLGWFMVMLVSTHSGVGAFEGQLASRDVNSVSTA